jgi:hypothetical protein
MQGTGIKSFRSQYRKQKEIILSNDVQNFFLSDSRMLKSRILQGGL